MEKPGIDLLREKYQLDARPRKQVLFFGRLLAGMLAVAAVALAALSYGADRGGGTGFPSLSLFGALRHLVSADEKGLRGEQNDRINVLLLGIGGEGHEGPQLSDTILFASVKPSQKQVGLLSIPRDLTVPIPSQGWRKVNAANAYGEAAQPGLGGSLSAQVVGDVLGAEIPYWVRVDFDGFADLVDELGGIDVEVERAFVDEQYPVLGKEEAECGDAAVPSADSEADPDLPTTPYPLPPPDYSCRFEALSFKAGWTRMDGDTALKYVRSRHGTNGESSDFARARRQQKVILSVREKLTSAATLLNPGRIGNLMGLLRSHLATNMELWEIVRLASLLKDVDPATVITRVLDAGPSSPLYATSLNGAYVLLPKNDDWTPVRQLAAGLVDPAANVGTGASAYVPAPARIELQNGTGINGLGFRTSQLLQTHGFMVSKVGNAAERGYAQTLVYDLTDGKKGAELKALRTFLEAEVTRTSGGWVNPGDVVPRELSVSPEDPGALATGDAVDFLVILGENSANLAQK